MCAYKRDFGDNYIITIVKTGLTTKTYAIVLSVFNLVSDFIKCNHPIATQRLVNAKYWGSLILPRAYPAQRGV
jgi:hypothetical protein